LRVLQRRKRSQRAMLMMMMKQRWTNSFQRSNARLNSRYMLMCVWISLLIPSLFLLPCSILDTFVKTAMKEAELERGTNSGLGWKRARFQQQRYSVCCGHSVARCGIFLWKVWHNYGLT
jgi:hypothetical protein